MGSMEGGGVSDQIPFEVPWLAIMINGTLRLHDKAGYDAWLREQFKDGERAMIIVVPLASDSPHYHARAFRYYWNSVLPLIADDIGEPNLEEAHDVLARQFVPLTFDAKKKRGLKLRRKSTSMEAMDCAQFCDYLDRLIIWAQTTRQLVIPMADRRWKRQKAMR